MKKLPKFGTLLMIWLCWGLIMVGYQAYAIARFSPQRPDYSLSWTEYETLSSSNNGKPYLLEPFLNDHVAWDSEYYLSIAVGGYHDPVMRAIAPDYNWENLKVALQSEQPEWFSMNYAFFPFYPAMIRLFAVPLRVFGMNPIATATLAGVLVSMLGTLGAMLGLYDMARDREGEPGGVRAAFYLLIFPAAMFLAEVYTEGLFLGLSFGTLALARRKHWGWAALLAACATWTRAAGGLLLLPLAWYWVQDGGLLKLGSVFIKKGLFAKFTGVKWWQEIGKILLIASPLWAYLIFSATLGESFHTVESLYFGRGLLLVKQSWDGWKVAWEMMLSDNMRSRAYFMVEFGTIVFSTFACLWMMRKEPALAFYGLATIFFSVTSGGAQGMHRYAMAAPLLFMLPARWGRSEAFDRSWTLANILLMGVFAAMFAFNFWAG